MFGTILPGAVGFLARSRQARAQRAWDRYHNDMVAVQASRARNVVAENTANVREQLVESQMLVATHAMRASASATASAAAAGVTGGSVAGTLVDLARSAGLREQQNASQFDQSLLAIDQQLQQIDTQQRQGTRQLTQGPSLLGAIGNMGLNILADYEAQPQSSGLEGGPQVSRGEHFLNQFML